MDNKKRIIFLAAAIVMLAAGILVGILVSTGGGDAKKAGDDKTVVDDNTGKNDKNTDTDNKNNTTEDKVSLKNEKTENNEIKENGDKNSEDEKATREDNIGSDTDDKTDNNTDNKTDDKTNDKTNDKKNDLTDDNPLKDTSEKNPEKDDAGEKTEKDENVKTSDDKDDKGKKENKVNPENNDGKDDKENKNGKENNTVDNKDNNVDDGTKDSKTEKDDNAGSRTDDNVKDTDDNTEDDKPEINPEKDGDKDKNDKDTGEVKKPDNVVITKPEAVLNTGKLTEKGSGYTGIKGTGDYNYGEALQKSLLFYELQRSGDLPENVRCNWRGDSCVNDGSDVGLDLSGGWYDAGDNVKFNLPMSYTAAMLGWSIIDNAEAYRESGQLTYALENIKWANDYFIKCHPSDNEYYYQVGNGNQDHSYWGAAETVEYRMSRPSYKVTSSNPGSAVCGETAASLAICSIVYKNIDKAYSEKCLKHAKSLYKFARDTKSDAGYTAANGFYTSWSGFYDELAWSGAWLYEATGDESYIRNAEEDYKNAGHDHDWCMCWDDVHIGAALMLAKFTGKQTYKDDMEKHLDWWSGISSDHITYSPKGLAWLDSWGSLRYATTAAYIALAYTETGVCSESKIKKYTEFAEKQANYALGSSGRSYVIGYGKNSPENPHHRTAQGSYCDNMNEPSTARHTLYGALVGGPDANDGYRDVVSDYNMNEVACDYNAGFTGLLAKMYAKYHGQTLKDFGAVEPVDINEFYVQGGVNVDGSDFMELRAYICNVSAWPARGGESLEFRYYVDLSEVYKAGGKAADIAVTTNYMAAGKSAGLKCWDEEKHIYYLSVDFSDSVIYPGGQDKYKKEIQVRLRNPNGTWDNSNDPSFVNMTKGGSALLTGAALYEKGKLVFGSEPAKGKNAGKTVLSDTGDSGKDTGKDNNKDNSGKENNGDKKDNNDNDGSGIKQGTAGNEAVSLSIEYDNASSSSSSISGRMNIVNNSDGSISLKDIKILFYFTNEDSKQLTFECYHTCINGKNGSYKQLNGCCGAFKSENGKNADTLCTITYSDTDVIEAGDTLACNFAIHHNDWSNMNLTNDHSMSDVNNIVVQVKGKTIFGKTPQ